MYLIIDANCACDAISAQPKPDFAPIMKAILSGKVRLVVGGTKLINEYMRLRDVFKLIRVLDQAGKAIVIEKSRVDRESIIIENSFELSSDDPHVIGLAIASGARLLCSRDKPLHHDFTNPKIVNKPRGKVYQNASHAHLLD